MQQGNVQQNQIIELEKYPQILVVDDEYFNFEILKASIGKYFKLHYSNSGKSCLSAAIAKRPNVILLDVCMPGLSGYDTCTLLKNTPETQDIPIIMVSGLESETEKQAGFDVGCDDYIVKPFTTTELVESVQSLITNQ